MDVMVFGADAGAVVNADARLGAAWDGMVVGSWALDSTIEVVVPLRWLADPAEVMILSVNVALIAVSAAITSINLAMTTAILFTVAWILLILVQVASSTATPSLIKGGIWLAIPWRASLTSDTV